LKTHLKSAVNKRAALVPRDRGTTARYMIWGCKAERWSGVRCNTAVTEKPASENKASMPDSEYELNNPQRPNCCKKKSVTIKK
jgi:hypothetical protein